MANSVTGCLITIKVAIFALGDTKVFLVSYENVELCLYIIQIMIRILDYSISVVQLCSRANVLNFYFKFLCSPSHLYVDQLAAQALGRLLRD